MAYSKVILDPIGNTMNVWWDDPKKAFKSQEVDSPHRNDVIITNKAGKPIGIEIIGFFPQELNISELKQAFAATSKEPYLLVSNS